MSRDAICTPDRIYPKVAAPKRTTSSSYQVGSMNLDVSRVVWGVVHPSNENAKKAPEGSTEPFLRSRPTASTRLRAGAPDWT